MKIGCRSCGRVDLCRQRFGLPSQVRQSERCCCRASDLTGSHWGEVVDNDDVVVGLLLTASSSCHHAAVPAVVADLPPAGPVLLQPRRAEEPAAIPLARRRALPLDQLLHHRHGLTG